MAGDVIIKPSGLFTDANPIGAVPHGSMREALNVVLRRDGILEPRPGFKHVGLFVDGGEPITIANPARLIPWGDNVLMAFQNGSAKMFTEAGVEVGALEANVFSDVAATDRFAMRAAQARGNLYVTGPAGTSKYDAADGSPFDAGVFGEGMAIANTGITYATASWAYRAVLVKRDANSVTVTSAPCPRSVAQGADPVSDGITAIVILTQDAATGDDVDIYRTTTATTAEPGDECFLLRTFTLTSADISAGYVTFTEDQPDSSLGAALYTNASREGALQGNNKPPRVADMAVFRGSLFGANVKACESVILTFTPDGSPGAAGIGKRTATGTTTSGLPTLTGISSTTGWAVGMLIYGAGVPAGTRLTVVGATTATMSANATASASVTLTVVDTMQLPGGEYIAMADPATSLGPASYSAWLTMMIAINTGQTPAGVWLSATGAPSVGYKAVNLSSTSLPYLTEVTTRLGLSTLDAGATFGAINTTKPTETQPPTAAIGTAQTDNADYVDINEDINGLIYSKADQPEAMPYPSNLIRVGSSSFAIDRIIATRDALWIFKRDGIFRLTGAGASSGWRVDPFDMSTFLVALDSAQLLGEDIYAWTNRGVVKVSDVGIVQISDASIGNLISEAQTRSARTPLNDSGPHARLIYQAGWAYTAQSTNEYVLALPDFGSFPEGNVYPTHLYVYNAHSLAWTRWTPPNPEDDIVPPVVHGVVGGSGLVLFAAYGGSNYAYMARSRDVTTGNDAPHTADEATIEEQVAITATGTASVYEANTVAIPGYTPQVGDFALIGSTPLTMGGDIKATVIAVADSENVTIYAPGSVSAVEASAYVKFYRSYSCEMEFVAKIASQPDKDKMWRGGSVLYGSDRLLERSTVSFTSSVSSSAVGTTTRFSTWPDNDTDASSIRPFWVPRNHTRAAVLFPKLSIQNAGSRFQIYGLALAGATAARVRK